jgi:predicted component of type VI protein secretion system
VPVAPAVAVAQPAASGFDVDSTQIMAPAFVQRTADAYLEALENAPEHTGQVPLSGNNVALGRDPKLSQLVFKDKSVSRLHARIMQSGGEYRLYDEGSASGTYHNYERVGLTPQTLKDNDDIHLGRVHLRFRLTTPAGDSDATQVFGPAGPSAPPPPPAGGDDMSTQAYMPHSPSAPAAGGGQDDEDPDDLSTQPFIPHQ